MAALRQVVLHVSGIVAVPAAEFSYTDALVITDIARLLANPGAR